MTKTYIPLGSKLLVELSPKEETNGIVLPEGSRRPGPMTAKVLAIGNGVNDQSFNVTVGDTVVLGLTPLMPIAVSKEPPICLIERGDIAAIEIERPETSEVAAK